MSLSQPTLGRRDVGYAIMMLDIYKRIMNRSCLMNSLDKMWASFVALGLMAVASLLVTYARTRTRGVARILLTIIAFLLFIPILLFGLVSML